MKKIYKSLALVAAVASSLISCQEVNPVEPIEEEYTYTFTLSNSDTKAYLDLEAGVNKWESGDQLGVYTDTPSGISYNRWGDITLSETVQFQISSLYALTSGSKVYCYFPYDADNSKGEAQNPSSVILSVPAIQYGKMNAMPMVGVPYTMSKDVLAQTDEPIADINMRNLGGVLQFNIFSTSEVYRSEKVLEVEFTADKNLAGEFAFDITQDSNLAIPDLSGNRITIEDLNLTVGSSKEDGDKALMVVKPGSYSGTLVVTTSAAKYTYTLNGEKSVERSHIKPLNVDLSKGERVKYSPDPFVTFDATVDFPESGMTITKGGITLKAGSGVLNNGTEYRFYKNTNVIVSSTVGVIKKIEFVCTAKDGAQYGPGCFSAKTGIYSYLGKRGTWEATEDVSSVTLTASLNQVRATYVKVTYHDSSIDPAIVNGTIDPFPARSSEGRYTINVKNSESDIKILDWDGVDFDDLDVDGQTIVYTVSDNESTSAKNGTITVALEDDDTVTGTISVSQAAAVFSSARTAVELKAANNSSTTVTITSDFDWTIDGVDAGYTVSPASWIYEATGKKLITITAKSANSTEGTISLGSFDVVSSKTGLGRITINVSQLSNKLAAPIITNVSTNQANKTATITWTGDSRSTSYTYYLVDENVDEIAGSLGTTANTSATVDIPEYDTDYYFVIYALGTEGYSDSDETVSENAINITEPVGGPVTLYYETFGDNGGSNTVLSSYKKYSDNNFTVVGDDWKVGKSTVNTSTGYSTASGLSAMWCSTENKSATIAFGDLSSYGRVKLSFGILNNAGGGKARTCNVTVSGNGGSSYGTDIVPEKKTNDGNYQFVEYEIPAASLSNLVVKFTNTSTNTTRVDDIKLETIVD